jgi:zinc protease
LVTWFDSHVLPGGAVLTIVGDVDAGRAVEQVRQRFRRWRGAAEEREQLLARGAEFNTADAGQRRDVPLAEKSNVSLVWMGPGVSKQDRERWAGDLVANFILGGDMSSRLNERLRLREGLTYGAFSWFSNGRAAGPFCVAVQVNPDNVAAAISATREVLAEYAAAGATIEELALAQSYLTGNFPVKLSNNAAVAAALTESVYLGKGVDYIQDYPQLINAVTLEEVAEVTSTLMNPDGLVLVVAGTLNADSAQEQ